MASEFTKRIYEGVQRALLEEEGVVFLPDGRVDMARCGWLK